MEDSHERSWLSWSSDRMGLGLSFLRESPGVVFGLPDAEWLSPFDADQEVFGVVDAEFFAENRGLTDDGGVEVGSEGGRDDADDAEPPRSLRTPFMAASSDAASESGCGREERWKRKLTTERLQFICA